MAKDAVVAVDHYTRELTIPIGSNAKVGPFELDEEVTLQVTGVIRSIEAERKKGEIYEDSTYRPAEIRITLTSVKFGDKESTFTTLNRKMDEDED